MPYLFKNLLLFSSVLLFSACGTSQKDLHNAETDRDNANKQNSDLQFENARLKAQLSHIYVTDHYLWVFGDVLVNYTVAVKSCHTLHYKLPDDAAKAEFLASVGNKFDDGHIVKPENIHVIDKTQALENGVALCALPRK